MVNNTIWMNDNKNENNWTRREVGALWTKLSKDKSQKYMTGHIQTSLEGKIDIVIFSNKDKKTDKAPDFRIYLSEKKKDEAPVARSGATQKSKATQAESLEEADVL